MKHSSPQKLIKLLTDIIKDVNKSWNELTIQLCT